MTAPSPRRTEILAATVAYVVENGLADLSLRPLAAAVGSSPRVLLYLFGSKEQLIREVLAVGRAEQLALLERSAEQGRSGRESLELLWAWLTSPEHRGMLRMFFEGYVRSIERSVERSGSADRGGSAGDGPWQGFGGASLREWLAPLTRVLAGHPADPTLVLAVLRGLLLDLMADDTHAERVDAAWEAFLTTIFPAAGQSAAGRSAGAEG